jgi:hypothetical protein
MLSLKIYKKPRSTGKKVDVERGFNSSHVPPFSTAVLEFLNNLLGPGNE